MGMMQPTDSASVPDCLLMIAWTSLNVAVSVWSFCSEMPAIERIGIKFIILILKKHVSIEISNSLFNEGIKNYLFRVSRAINR